MVCLADICQIHVHFLLELAAVVVSLLCYNQVTVHDSELESPERY